MIVGDLGKLHIAKQDLFAVVSTLIEQALARSPDTGEPRITVECQGLEGSFSIFRIEDNCNPIPEDVREHLFDLQPVSQLGAAGTLGHLPNESLNLAFVAEILQRYDGQIWMEPCKENGSTFLLKLPFGTVGHVEGSPLKSSTPYAC